MCLITALIFFLHYTEDIEERFKQHASTIATEKVTNLRENKISNVTEVHGEQVVRK